MYLLSMAAMAQTKAAMVVAVVVVVVATKAAPGEV
jgi:hypothetical protein